MTRTAPRPAAPVARWHHVLQCRLREVLALFLAVLGGYLLLALYSYDQDDPGWTHTSKADQVQNLAGGTGAWFADVSFTAFGYMAYLFPILCLLLAIRVFHTRRPLSLGVLAFALRLVGLVVVMLAGTGLADVHFGTDPMMPISSGGALGRGVGQLLGHKLDPQPATLLFLGFFVLGSTLLTGLSWFGLMDMLGKVTLDFLELILSPFNRLLGTGVGRIQAKTPPQEPTHQEAEGFDPLEGEDSPALGLSPAGKASHSIASDDPIELGNFLIDEDPPLSAEPARGTASTALSKKPTAKPLSAVDDEDELLIDLDDELSPPPTSVKPAPEVRPVRPAVPKAVTPASDWDDEPLDWKDESTPIKPKPFVRPASLPQTEPSVRPLGSVTRPTAAPQPVFSALEPSLALEESEPELSLRAPAHELSALDDKDDPYTLMDEPGRLEPSLGGLEEDAESLASMASRIISADRQRVNPELKPAAVPVQPSASSMPSEEDEESDWPVAADFQDRWSAPPMAAAPEPKAAVNPQRPPVLEDEPFDEADLDFDGRLEPSLALPRAATGPRPIEERHWVEPLDEDAVDEPFTPVAASFSQPLVAVAKPHYFGGTLPPISLLDEPEVSQDTCSAESLEATSRLVELRLKEFGVSVTVEAVHPGPVITRFEIQPAPGIKSSRISNLAKDLARSLAVPSVRVVEVIPGRTTVGIEIPNEHRQIVRLSEVLSSEAYADAASPVTLALGHDISGQPVTADLAKMPHLLVAGTTGSGKSVGVNAMILSILLKSTPDEARLIMIDPKMLELSIYEGIPHLLCPVVTDMKEAANALRWSVAEMERRYKLMAALGVRNLAGFNRKVKEAEEAGRPLADPLFRRDSMDDVPPALKALPTIVVFVDEFADMMMIVGKKVEELIARIAQKARAAGIHLILATQRPSVDVITGLIKANIPTRIAFQVSSRIDSRTILDQGGAEQLLGHGDMLYMPPGTGHPIRVHGAFVSDDEVHRVVEAWKQRGQPDYIDDILSGAEEAGSGFEGGSGGGEGGEGSEEDPLYDEAVRFVTESRRASISAVQRKLKIGYNRAARMIEAMEEAGVVTSMSTNGSREVIAPAPIRD